MAYYYYYDNSFYTFFLLFLFLLLILIILFPNYTKKDIVPPLTTTNYEVDTTFTPGTFSLTDSESTTFSTMVIKDGEAGNEQGIDFAAETTEISYIPYYGESHRNIQGYFELNLGTSFSSTLAFRVADLNISGSETATLKNYNYGWSSLTTPRVSDSTNNIKPLYRVIVPFDLPGYKNRNHKLGVQIASANGSNVSDLELSSSYLYYYTT